MRLVRDRSRRMGYGTRGQRRRVGAGAILLVVPGAITSAGTAFTPVERGEPQAVAALCAAIPPGAAVLLVERVTADRFTQVVRGQCGVPAARVPVVQGTDTAPQADVARLVARVKTAGRVPVLLAAEPAQLTPYGHPSQVFTLRTRQDERSLVSPPDGTWSLASDVWMTTG
jgi:hypothetical protein